MKHLISSCKPDLRQLTTRNLLDLEASPIGNDNEWLIKKKMFTGKMQTQMWTHKSVIMKSSHKQNKINP